MLRALGAVLIVWCSFSSGCTSMLLDKKVDVKNIFGPIGRKAREAVEISERDPLAPMEGIEELDAARKLYDEQKYSEALAGFQKVAKKYKDKPIEEEAMFMVAESYFRMQQYPAAQDAYDELFKKYPSTKFLEQSTQHLFEIALYWLDSPKPATEVELAHFSRDDSETRLEDIPEARVPYVFPLTPNLFDRSRPLFDTQGRAMQALRSVWMNDPTGPLADKALMITATHHLRKGDFQEADHYFATIREQYADRKTAASAYVLGQHASYNSYQGSKYDGKQLDEARKLTDSALRMYPDLPQANKLKKDLKRMKQESSERDWEKVQFYKKRGENDAVAVYCEYILRDYPDSPRAADARKLLLELGPDYAKGILPAPVYKPAAPSEPYDAQEDQPQKPGRVHLSDDAIPLPERE
jgi:outer membrane protein assembly factor BamD (BamD/ComL family)